MIQQEFWDRRQVPPKEQRCPARTPVRKLHSTRDARRPDPVARRCYLYYGVVARSWIAVDLEFHGSPGSGSLRLALSYSHLSWPRRSSGVGTSVCGPRSGPRCWPIGLRCPARAGPAADADTAHGLWSVMLLASCRGGAASIVTIQPQAQRKTAAAADDRTEGKLPGPDPGPAGESVRQPGPSTPRQACCAGTTEAPRSSARPNAEITRLWPRFSSRSWKKTGKRSCEPWSTHRRTGKPFKREYRVVVAQRRRALARGARHRLGRESEPVWRGVTLDITERKRAEKALMRTEKLAVAGRLAAADRPRDQQSPRGDHEPLLSRPETLRTR